MTKRVLLKIAIASLLCFYIFYIPAMSYTTKLNLVAYVLLPLLGISTIIYLFLYKRINLLAIKTPIAFALLFCILAFISTLLGVKQFQSLPRLYLVFLSGFVLFLSFHVFNSQKNALMLISISMLVFVLFYFGFSFFTNRERLIGWLLFRDAEPLTLKFFTKIGLDGGGNPNMISSYFGTSSILFLYFALFGQSKKNLLYLIPSLISMFAGFTTDSRQYLIAMLFCAMFLLFTSIRKKKTLILILVPLIIALIILFFTLPVFKSKSEAILIGLGLMDSPAGDKSAYTRLIMQIEAFELGGNRLFFGYGADGFEVVSGWNGYAHNSYANLYMSFGIIGMIIYFLPFVLMLIRIRKAKTNSYWLVLAFYLYYFILGFFIVWYKDKIFYIAFALIVYFYYFSESKMRSNLKDYCEINI